MTDLFKTGIRPAVDVYLLEKAAERRDYGEYWPASSAGYCMRKVIFDRLQVPYVKDDARKQRVFEVGHIFHEWLQRITQDAKLSIAQEVELQHEGLMIRGHFDDLVIVQPIVGEQPLDPQADEDDPYYHETMPVYGEKKLILYDFKTQNSRAFSYQKDRPMSHFHRMQTGTYLYMLRTGSLDWPQLDALDLKISDLQEARILKISKDDLRMSEQQLLWSPDLEKDVVGYWSTLNGYWANKVLPKCTCADHEGGFMAREAYNPYFYDGEPCSAFWAVQYDKLKDWKF